MQDRHLQEQLNRRALYLRLLPRLWVVPAAMAGGALVCFLIYTMVIVTVYGQRQFRQTSTFEVNFAQNEETGKAYDYYNAATWQGLIFTHPQIADTVEEELPEGMDMETASEDTKADLISDIRYLTVEVTTPSADDTAQLSLAIRDGLEHFGETAKEFDSIEFLSATEPALVVVSDRSRNAALLGMVLGLLISWCALYLHALLDDAIYVPEDARKRYGYPVLGVLPAGPHDPLPANLVSALSGADRVLVMSLDGAQDARRIVKQLADDMSQAIAQHTAQTRKDADKREAAAGHAGTFPGRSFYGEQTEQKWEEFHCGFLPTGPLDDPSSDTVNRSCRNVIVIIHYGKEGGPRMENLLDTLSLRGYHIAGLLLVDADQKFLKRYYQ